MKALISNNFVSFVPQAMERLIDIDVVILNKIADWNDMDDNWEMYYDLDVETKSFIQLFKHLPELEKYYEKLLELDYKKHNHQVLISILQETSEHITESVYLSPNHSEESSHQNTNGHLYQ